MKNNDALAIPVALITTICLVFVFLYWRFYLPRQNSTSATPTTSTTQPADDYCLQLGGVVNPQVKPNGDQYQICVFEDNYQCETLALFNGHCAAPGLRVTGYDTPAQIYCAVTGGQADINQNTCTFNGQVCQLDQYFVAECPA